MVGLHDEAINSEREGQIDAVGWLLVAFAVVVALVTVAVTVMAALSQ